jgi:predicted nucleotidyltransferase
MEKLVYQGSPDEQARILFSLKNAARSIAERVGLSENEAVVLTGGFGRGEGALSKEPDGAIRPFNDFDILLVGARPAMPRSLLLELKSGLPASLGVDFVDLGYVRASDLQKAEPTVFLYDLKRGSQVLWGSQCALDAVPPFAPSELPLTEGTRFFLNRGVGLLSLLLMIERGEAAGALRRSAANAWSKTVLAIGDSFLLERKLYHWSYATRLKRMDETGAFPKGDGFASKYRDAAVFKVTADFGKLPSEDPLELFAEARSLHERYFRLFEERRTFSSIADWREYPAAVVRAGLIPFKRRVKESLSTLARSALQPRELMRFARLPLVGEERRLALLPLLLYAVRGRVSQTVDRRYVETACRLELGRTGNSAEDWIQLASKFAGGAHP